MVTKVFRELSERCEGYIPAYWGRETPSYTEVDTKVMTLIAWADRRKWEAERTSGFESFEGYHNAGDNYHLAAVDNLSIDKLEHAKRCLRLARGCFRKALKLIDDSLRFSTNPKYLSCYNPLKIAKTIEDLRQDYLAINREQTRRRLCRERLGKIFKFILLQKIQLFI